MSHTENACLHPAKSFVFPDLTVKCDGIRQDVRLVGQTATCERDVTPNVMQQSKNYSFLRSSNQKKR